MINSTIALKYVVVCSDIHPKYRRAVDKKKQYYECTKAMFPLGL
jgi:hypothetical protein